MMKSNSDGIGDDPEIEDSEEEIQESLDAPEEINEDEFEEFEEGDFEEDEPQWMRPCSG